MKLTLAQRAALKFITTQLALGRAPRISSIGKRTLLVLQQNDLVEETGSGFVQLTAEGCLALGNAAPEKAYGARKQKNRPLRAGSGRR